ncbi:MAG: hypothetical protein KDD48_02315 [Bdellovibrionales bacterium]|nr:hypothetical protein [Bdellovibrionales bacterium]
MKHLYLQVFSMTDHTTALNNRYKGPYQGLNAALTTSMFESDKVFISKAVEYQGDEFTSSDFKEAQIIMAYRHSDTGVLEGTSELLIAIGEAPWAQMPGLEIVDATASGKITLRLWDQDISLEPGRVTRIHFGKTIVYMKNYGFAKTIQFTENKLEMGPAVLHAEEIHDNLTIAPPSGSGMVVKMGQETEH